MKIKNTEIENYLGKIDLLILSSGFEERSKTLSNFINKSKIYKSVIFHLEDNYSIASTNMKEIIGKLDSCEVISFPKNDSFNTFYIFYEKLSKIINDIKDDNVTVNISVDVTAFSREILLILIKVLTRPSILNNLEITFIHTPVENYTGEDENWLTKGVREIRPVFGYSGVMTPSKKLLLIVFNGFEDERTEIIIEAFEPNALILANPSKTGSINPSLKKLVDLKYNFIKTKFNNVLKEEIEFSCLEIESTINLLEKIYLKYSDEYNIAISPLNNKTSTIAIAIASIRIEAIQVCYASANQYNINKKLTPSNYFLVYKLSDYYKINA